MVTLLAYSIQTLILAALLVVVCQRLRTLDLFLAGTILFWVVAVIGIYARYKTDQVYFYSNDQAYHLLLMGYYVPVEGVKFGLEELTSWRYPVILPSYFLSRLGFDPILANKFIHLVFVGFDPARPGYGAILVSSPAPIRHAGLVVVHGLCLALPPSEPPLVVLGLEAVLCIHDWDELVALVDSVEKWDNPVLGGNEMDRLLLQFPQPGREDFRRLDRGGEKDQVYGAW